VPNNPDAMERRELLYGSPKRVPDYVAMGREYLESGRQTDAMEAFDRVPDDDERLKLIKEVKAVALKAGNYFILNRLNNTLELSKDEWLDAYDAAKAQDKLHYALKIARQIEDEVKIREAEEALGIAPAEPPEGQPAEGEDKAGAESE
jgi:hypothetical protein